MNKYIILGFCGGMGGGNLYTANRCESVRRIGWDPVVIYTGTRRVEIPQLRVFEGNSVDEMLLPPAYYTRKQQKKIIERLLFVIGYNNNDHYFIESNGVRYSYWGEQLAKTIGCKHFAFLLEPYFALHDNYVDFFKFKLDRRELAGIREYSLKDLFKNKVLINDSNNSFMLAHSANSLIDVEYETNIDFSSYDFRIANIGRDTKPYVKAMLDDLLAFLKSNPRKKILVLMIGGEKESIVCRNFSHKIDKLKGGDFFCTGYIYPIPYSMVKSMDVIIGSSGCISVGLTAGKSVISYKDNDVKPYAITYACKGERHEYDIENRNISELLSEMIENKKYSIESDDTYCVSIEKIREDLHKGLAYMMKTSSLVYFDTSKIYPSIRSRRLYVRTLGRIIPFSYIVKKAISFKKK